MIARTTTGRGFGGLIDYITHDAPTDDIRHPESSSRVAWTHTENLPTDDPVLAGLVMNGVARDAPMLKQLAGVSARGRKLKDPLLHLMLSWPPGENPAKQEMLSAARGALKALGLDEHQAVFGSHTDRDHQHVHVAVNRVSTKDGRAVNLRQCGRVLSAWAEQYERDHGKIQVPNRVARRQAVAEGRKPPPMQRPRTGPRRRPRLPAERRGWTRHYQRQRAAAETARQAGRKPDPAVERRRRVRVARRQRMIRPVRIGIAAGQTAVTALARGGRSAGSALARSGQTTVTALARGGRSAGSALTRSGQTAVTALARGGRSAGSALTRSGQTAVTALARGGRSAGSALTRLSGLDDVIARRAIKKRADEVSRKFETGTPEQRHGIYEERRLLSDYLQDREHSDEYYSHSNPREEHARLEDRLRDRLNALLLSDDYLNSSPQQRNRRRDRLFTDEEPNRDQIPRRGEVDAAEAPLQALVGDVEFYGRPDGEHRPTLTPEVASRPATGSSPPAPMTGPPVHPVPASSLSYRATASSSALAKALVDAVDRNDREDLAALQSLVAYAHRSRNDRAPEAAGPARTDRTRGEETPPRAVRAEPTRPAVRGGPPVQPPPSTTPPSRRPAVRVHHPAQPRPAVRGREREPAPSATLEQELEFRKLKGLGEEAGGRAWYYKSLGKVAPGVRPGEETSEQVDQALELAFEHFRPRPRPEPAREPDPPRPARPQVKDRGRGRDF